MSKIKNCLKSLKNFFKGKNNQPEQSASEKTDVTIAESTNLISAIPANKLTNSMDSVGIGAVFDGIESILEPAAPTNNSVLGEVKTFNGIYE